jgi:uncharacterized membrane protein
MPIYRIVTDVSQSGGSDMAEPYEQAIYAVRLRPHRSFSRGRAKALVVGFSAVCLGLSLPFYLMGAWPIVGFLGLVALALWLAFEVSFRAARAYEDVRVTPLELSLAKVSQHGRARKWRFNPAWVRIDRSVHEEFGLQRLALVSHGRAVEFAGFLGPEQKAEVADALARALAQARKGPDLSQDSGGEDARAAAS